MPLSVPDASQLEPQAPQQPQFFGRRSSHSRGTTIGRSTLDPYSSVTELGPSHSSRSSQSLMAPVSTLDESPITVRSQHTLLRRESASSQALTRPFAVYQPPLYSPPMNSYSPAFFPPTPEGSGANTSTPSSAVEPSGTISLGGLNFQNAMPPFLPALSAAGGHGGNVPTVTSSMSHHRTSLSTPTARVDFLETSGMVDPATFISPGTSSSSSPPYAIPAAAAAIPRQTSPSHHSHSSGSSSPSPVMHSTMMPAAPGPSIPVPAAPVSEAELPAASTTPSTDPSYDVIVEDGIVTDPRTTLYIKNIPHRVQPASLLSVMVSMCPNNAFQFLYLPNSKQNTRSNNGYAFVKLNSTEYIPRIVSVLNGNHWPQYNTERKCEVKYASIQSFQRLLQQFDSTTLLTDRDRWRPFIFYHGEYTQLTAEIFSEIRDPTAVDSEENTSAPVSTMIAKAPIVIPSTSVSTTNVLPLQQDQQHI